MTTRQRAGAADGAARTKPQWEPAPPDAHRRWLEGKSLEELEAKEQAGRALYPDTIIRRNPTKPTGLEEVHVMLQVPMLAETLRARVMALDWARRQLDLDKRPTIAEATSYLGEFDFNNMLVICQLSLCIFDAEPLEDGTHPRYMAYDDLLRGHPADSLKELDEKLHHYQKLESPRLDEVDEKSFWQVVAAMARCGNATPLAVIGGEGQLSFIATMAARLHSFQTEQSGSPSTRT
jgi:hypothetical protein